MLFRSSVVDPKEAAETFAYLKQMGELDGIELPPEDAPPPAASGTAGGRP